MAISATSPHSGGEIISYALWFKTQQQKSEMILIFFGNAYGVSIRKDMYTVTLKNGYPILYFGPDSFLKSDNEDLKLNDGKWHHIAISMPHKSCFHSDVIMHIDGVNIPTTYNPEYNKRIFFSTSGRLSLGGFGFSFNGFKEQYPDFSNFVGHMDQFILWGRSIEDTDINKAMLKNMKTTKDRICKKSVKVSEDKVSLTFYRANLRTCEKKCKHLRECWGYGFLINNSGENECKHFKDDRPEIGKGRKGALCAVVL